MAQTSTASTASLPDSGAKMGSPESNRGRLRVAEAVGVARSEDVNQSSLRRVPQHGEGRIL